MKKNKILTISVAAYNVEKFIEQNIESFINSEVKDLIEVIVTDDESKDATPEIVQRYAEKYPNTIKLVKQKNKGPGSTVNSGITNATGKYFRMVDGDDWVDTENLNILVKKLQKIDVDMIITNHRIYDNSEQKVIKSMKFPIISDQIMNIEELKKDLYLNMHNVTYKTSILKENKIIINNGFYTDMEYLILPMPFVSKLIYYDMDIYVYRIAREGQSISLSGLQKNYDMHCLVLNRLINYYEDKKDSLPQNIKSFFANRISKMADQELMIIVTSEKSKFNNNEIKKYFKYIKDMSKDIYKEFIKGKKERMLLFSNYSLYRVVAKIIIKMFKS